MNVVSHRGGRRYTGGVSGSLIARVRNGRLILDQATDLPEGSEVALAPVDGADDWTLTDAQRIALAESIAEADRGEVLGAADVLSRLASSR